MKKMLILSFAITLSLFANAQSITLESFATDFSGPVDIQNAGDERLFVVEQRGVIKILNADGSTNATSFLDIQSQVNFGGERGLLGLAFHPDYQNNGFFFVHYSDAQGDTQISRFTVDSGNPDIADPSSELLILNVDQPQGNHNGGTITFGPGGFLYIALGDGGGANDTDNNAQNPTLLLGKLLRIDIDNPVPGGANYSIPADNPFISDPGTRDEIWAIGLRNPFRISIDFVDEDIWIGDVGQNAREEVNKAGIDEGGLNYGWRCYEGNINTPGVPTADCLRASEYTFPVYDYVWSGGGSVIGGRVYRGSIYSDIQGVYIFGDIDGMLGTLDTSFNYINQSSGNPSGTWVAFGEDLTGEMYVVSIGGTVYKILGGELNTNQTDVDLFTVAPNPAKDNVEIKSSTQIKELSVFDIHGRRVLNTNYNSKNITISVSNLESGLYLLNVTDDLGNRKTSKLIVQ